MTEWIQQPVQIDLTQFKLHIDLRDRLELTIYFNSPSRKFYLSLIGLVVNEMKRLGKITSIPLQEHLDLIALLNETVGAAAGSSDKESLLPRIYRKWKDALPDLENAPLFKVLGRKKGYDEGIAKTYQFTEMEKDLWANLFEYKGSEENVRLRFSVDRLGASLEDVAIVYEESQDGEAWERFVSSLKVKVEYEPETVPDFAVKNSETPVSSPNESRIGWLKHYRWVALVAAIGVILGVVAFSILKTYLSPPSFKIVSPEKMAFPLHDKPSIAVLPFANMTGDPKEEYFSDGMTEEIITALSRVPDMFVIAKQSTFAYKGKPLNIKQIGEELGIRYILEGSVSKKGDKIRMIAQLTDATTGHHPWAERYDRGLKDIFALRDDITLKVVIALQVKLTIGEIAKVWGKGTQNLDAYLKYLEGVSNYVLQTKEKNALAKQLAEEIIHLDPTYPRGYILLCQTHLWDILLGTAESSEKSLATAVGLIKKAIALDDAEPTAHGILGSCYLMSRQYDQAIAQMEQAMSLNPNSWDNLLRYGFVLLNSGKPDEAISALRRARRLNLNIYSQPFYFFHITTAYRLSRQYKEAVETAREALPHLPDNLMIRLQLTATYNMMGRLKEARAEAAEVLRINPKFSLDYYRKTLYYRDRADVDGTIDALRKAGLK